MPTIKDVADLAGVAPSTVSRAMRGHTSIPQNTSRRIQDAAHSIGYKSNPILSEMMSAIRSGGGSAKATLAYLTNSPTEHEWRKAPTFLELYEGAAHRADELGFGMDVIWTRDQGMSSARLTKILFSRGIQGILIGPLNAARGHLSLQWDRFSIVALGHSISEPRVHRVVNNQKRTVDIALRQVWKHGYRRPALFLLDSQNKRGDLNFTAGYFSWAADRAIPPIPPLLFRRLDRTETARWLKRCQPDVLLGSGAASHAFIRQIPNAPAFVDLDLAHPDGEVAGMVQNHRIVGAAAVDFVIQQMSHGERGVPSHVKMLMAEGTWFDGASLPRRRNAIVALQARGRRRRTCV